MATFVILKPGYQSVYSIIKEFLFLHKIHIVRSVRDVKLTLDDVEKLYEQHKKKDFFLPNCYYMVSGPVSLMVLSCKPDKFRSLLKEKIRPTLGKNIRENVMHGSDSESAYVREMKIFEKYFK